MQDVVDRRFSRARYEDRRRIRAFLEELRAGAVPPEAIQALLRELLDDPALELPAAGAVAIGTLGVLSVVLFPVVGAPD